LAIVERWLQAVPGSLSALEMRMRILAAAEDHEAAGQAASAVLAREPRHREAQSRLLKMDLAGAEPEAALRRVDGLLATAASDDERRALLPWKAMVHDHLGQAGEAVAVWEALHAGVAGSRLPLPQPVPRSRTPAPPAGIAAAAVATPGRAQVGFLFGLPGSRVEHLAGILGETLGAFRADRHRAGAPDDAFQSYFTPRRLQARETSAADVVAGWRAQFAARGLTGEVMDWLLWWDNELAAVLHAEAPEATLFVALRDPRDMLLDWLAFGTSGPFRMESVATAAEWLATQLEQLAVLHEQGLMSHRLIRLDDAVADPQQMAALLGNVMSVDLPAPPGRPAGMPPFPKGYWHRYRDVLAAPFARLSPVANRLGYP
ncbi:MAG TPA: adenylate cyclase, partial [Luteimonas sp.]|nr:adenylate cyclase [Luteimonas sp.]